MPVKNTKKAPANNKKAEVKKVEKKVEESVKRDVKEEVEKVEKKVEAFEKKADKEVDNLVKKVGFVDKIINASWMKEILNLSFMNGANERVRKHLEKICKILGIIGIIGSVLMLITSFVFLFRPMFWMFLLYLIGFVIVLVVSRGLMKMKKWFPAVSILCLVVELVVLIISVFSPRLSFGLQLLSLLVAMICTLFVLENKDMFKN